MRAIRLRFGRFELVGESELRTAEGRVPLQPQPLRLLHVLARRAGEIVTREELRRTLWGDVHVDHEHGINFAVRQLRVALEDDPGAPRFVETLPRVGYRFLAAVERVHEAIPPALPPPPPRAAPWPLLLPAAAACVAIAAVAATLSAVPSAAAPPRVLVRPMAGAPGLADDVILELARVPPARLSVLAPTTASAAAGKDPRGLGASHVVEARVVGGRVDARMTASDDGRVVWAGRLDAASPFAAAHLARELALALGAPASGRPQRRAAAALCEGWRRLRFEQPGDAERALAFFAQAAQDDPRSAEAQVGLAESWRRVSRPARETSRPWQDAALRAIALDPEDARGHLSLAAYRLYRERDLGGSRASFERALALAPGLAEVHDAYAAWFSAQGRHEEALTLARRAADLDPLSTGVQLDLGWYLYLARRYGEAAAALERAHELQGSVGCLDYALRARIAANEWPLARGLGLRIMALRSAEPSAVAAVRAARDDREAVQRHLRWNLARLEGRDVPGGALAVEHAWLGDAAGALRLLDQTFVEGGGWVLCFLTVDPAFDALRDRPEFQVLVARARIRG